MCKIGILAIGLDLCDSALQRYRTLAQPATPPPWHVDALLLTDLLAHAFAMVTLVRAFRGQVNRQATGRVVAPVLAVKFAAEVDASLRRDRGGVRAAVRDALVLAKALLFVIMTVKLATGRDRSCVGPDEWFPGDKDDAHGGDGGEGGPPRMVVVEGMGEGTCWDESPEKKAKRC